ncbi:MAG: hypothetical protein IPL35_09565 [Sphingobacteriales bacterium]|nr:hypothetical protein [Sphingobacteriales bacterium]
MLIAGLLFVAGACKEMEAPQQKAHLEILTHSGKIQKDKFYTQNEITNTGKQAADSIRVRLLCLIKDSIVSSLPCEQTSHIKDSNHNLSSYKEVNLVLPKLESQKKLEVYVYSDTAEYIGMVTMLKSRKGTRSDYIPRIEEVEAANARIEYLRERSLRSNGR